MANVCWSLRMKVCLLIFLVIVGYYNVSAHYCTSDEKLEKIFAENTEAEFLMQQKYLQIRESTRVLKSMTERNTNHPTVRIPVVWHVLYDNDEPTTKLPMAAIQREMDSINKWFAAENEHFSESSSFFGPVIAQAENLNIVFELAAFDQNGNPFNGVNYVESPIGASCSADSDDMFFSNQGGADIWEHTEYLNMYTCGIEGGVLGFASFPFLHDPLTDGIVLYYGGVGEPEPFEGTVSVHEIGHFLGLFHTFQGGCDSFGDFVDDTPETPGPAFDRVSPFQACPGMNGATDSLFSVCGGVAMVENVMDYNYASCNRYFSKGQAEIMRYWMDTTSVRSSLATSPALGEPCATHNCAGKECGDDGCGGRCGLCDESHFETCISGICVQNLPCPTYDCTDATCGDDGCGGSCGSCFAEQSCFNGICENPNEICSDARIIDAVALMNNPQSYSGSNLGADFSVDCPELGATLEYPVWFKYTANMDGVLTVDTIGSGYDTALALFSGSCSSLTCMEYNDDIVLYYNPLSEISISVVNGNDYFIAVGGFAEEQGEFLLNVKISCASFDCGGGRECGDDGCGGSCGSCSSSQTCDAGFCISSNDECAQAITISISGVDGETLSYEAVTTSQNDFQGCGYEELYHVLWYTFTTSSNHQIVIDTVGSQFDTTLAVFSGSCGSLTCEEFNDDMASLVFVANSGVQYFIAVGGFSGQDFGSVQLNVNVQCETYDCFDKECGSDGCSGQCGSCETNFICGSSNTCEFLPPCPQYDCTDKFCGADGCGGFCGTCSDEQQCLNGYCESPNDYCSSATNIAISPDGTFYPGFVSEVGADEVNCGQRVLPNPVWYAFTVTQLTRVYLSSNSDRFDSQLAILSGDCGSLTCEVFNEDPSELKPYVGAEVEFLAQPGVNYKVAVGSDNISYSDFFLEVLELPLDSPSSSSTPPPSVSSSPAAPSVSRSPVVPSATRSPVNDQSPSSSRTTQPNSFSDDSSSSRDDDDNSSNSTNNSSDDSDSRSSSSSSAMQLPVACVVTLLFALFNL